MRTFLLLGENGTGKDLIARYVYEQSPRKNEIYVPIDLGSIPDTLFESELFGYEKRCIYRRPQE